ncbi:MAG: hypothetical protein ACP6IU_15355, partial [Candidatus Asgardarchaeia archaeon]
MLMEIYNDILIGKLPTYLHKFINYFVFYIFLPLLIITSIFEPSYIYYHTDILYGATFIIITEKALYSLFSKDTNDEYVLFLYTLFTSLAQLSFLKCKTLFNLNAHMSTALTHINPHLYTSTSCPQPDH